MKTGAILTMREADDIRKKLNSITKGATDRKLLERCRMIHLTINKAQRRVLKKMK